MTVSQQLGSLNYTTSHSANLQIVGLEDVSFLCTDYPLPGISLPRTEMATPFTVQPFHGDKPEFSDLTINFIVDKELNNWLACFEWLTDMGFSKRFSQYRNEPMKSTTAILHIYLPNNKKFMEVVFNDIVIVSLGELDFGSVKWGDDNLNLTCSATFSYSSYHIKKENGIHIEEDGQCS